MNRGLVRHAVYAGAGALLLAAGACGTAAGGAGTAAPAASCDRLIDLDLPDTTITHAESAPAGGFTPPGGSAALDAPAFCRVAGVIAPAINFEVWLPETGWNGKFQGIGNGGMAGSLRYDRMATALNRGYAAAATDTGHVAQGGVFDATWAFERPDLIEDFGHRALHLTTVNAKAITAAHYGRPPDYSYYVGCSKGGQQGLMEAQRYPQDYDGLIAGNPAHDWTSFYAGAHLWYSQATLADPDSYIPADKLPLLGDAVNAACDGIDGIEDGVLDDPRACNFDLAQLTCTAGQDPETCFTPKQVEAVRAIWAGAENAAGEQVYPGLVPGGEATPGGWDRWISGGEPFAGLHWLAAEGFFRNLVFDDLEWDFRSFDYDEDLAFALEKVGAALDAVDPDLRPLRDRGGKLIVYHGWSDADISPLGSVDYYEDVVSVVGDGRGPRDGAGRHPGVLPPVHGARDGPLRRRPGSEPVRRAGGAGTVGRSGAGAGSDRGLPPDRRRGGPHAATLPVPGDRPLNGTGSTDDAANFVCVRPD